MKKISKYLVKNKLEIIFLLLANALILFLNFSSLCGYNNKYADFDLQALLVWDYAAKTDLIPYKDIYYPYGLLMYYKNANTLATALFLLTPVISFSVIFWVFKKFFKDKIVYFVSLIFLSFVIFVYGMDIFIRYGISLCLTSIFAYIFYRKLETNKKILFFLGFITSSVFILVHDQGFYSLLTFLIMFFLQKIYKLINGKHEKKWFYINLKELLYFLVGLVIGFLPFLFYLIKNDAFASFWTYITVSTPEFPQLSKTPFFTLFFSFNNLFSAATLASTILFIVYKRVSKQKLNLSFYLVTAVGILLLLLEQKNLVRSMQYPVVLVSYFLFAIISWDVLNITNKNQILKKALYISSLSIIFLFLFFLNPKKNTNVVVCNTQIASYLYDKDDKQKVVNKLREYNDFNNKILSFPGDPIFYVLLGQKPPFYPSIYEASSQNSQDDLISFMQNDVRYVVINTSNREIQDSVPNYIRGRYVLSFILTNYSVKDSVGKYLILEKEEKSDFFVRSRFQSVHDYQDYLLNASLESIPLSEGLHKSGFLSKRHNQILTKYLTEELMNDFLRDNTAKSNKMALLIKSQTKDLNSTLKITSDEGITTNISFMPCTSLDCIINLSSVPLFYTGRTIKKIEIPDDAKIRLIKISVENFSILW